MKNLVFIDGTLFNLKKRLLNRKFIKGRIVLQLNADHYLLRLMGHNLIMQSPLHFQNGSEILFKIKKVGFKIELQVVTPARKLFQRNHSSKMNILI